MLGAIVRSALAASLAGLAAPVLAQVSAEAPGAESKAACELHVWPARGFHAVYYGWVHGGTVDGALKGRDGYDPVPANALEAPVQSRILSGLKLDELTGLPGHRVVLHDGPLTTTAIRSTEGRHVSDSPPCYAELMVEDIVFQNNAIRGKWLNVIFRFRQFDGAHAKRTFGNFVLERLNVFPPKNEAEQRPGLEEIEQAYRSAVLGFGKALTAKPRKK